MSINISNINSYFYTTQIELNSKYKSKEFFCKGATWIISIDNVNNNYMEIRVSYNGNPIINSLRLSINNGNNNEYFNIDRKYHYIHNYSIDDFYDKGFCIYKFEYDNIENIKYLTVGITLNKDIKELSYQQYFSKKLTPEGFILLPNISSFNNLYIHEIQDKQYIYSKYIDQINNFNNFIDDYYDVEFEVGIQKKIIKAHRVILASRCPFFKSLFNNEISDNIKDNNHINIKFPNEDYVSFKALIEYLYKGKCYVPKSKKVLKTLLNLAYQYHVNNLIEEIEIELLDHSDLYIEDNNEEINESYDKNIIIGTKDIHIFSEDMVKESKEYTNQMSTKKRKTNGNVDNDDLPIKKRHSNNNSFVDNNHPLEFTFDKKIEDYNNDYDETEENKVFNKRDESDAGVFNNVHLIEDEHSIGDGDILSEMEIVQNDSDNSDQHPSKNIVDMIDIESGLSDTNDHSDEDESPKMDDYEVIEINESTNETISNDGEVYEIIDDSVDHAEFRDDDQEIMYDEEEEEDNENNEDYKGNEENNEEEEEEEEEEENENNEDYEGNEEEEEESNENEIENDENDENEIENDENDENESEGVENDEDDENESNKNDNEDITLNEENDVNKINNEEYEDENDNENEYTEDDEIIGSDAQQIEEESSNSSSSTETESDEIQQEDDNDKYDYDDLNSEDQDQVIDSYDEKSESEEEEDSEEVEVNEEKSHSKHEKTANSNNNEVIVIADNKGNESEEELDMESSFNDHIEKEFDISSSHEDINHFEFNTLNPIENENLGALHDDGYYGELLPDDNLHMGNNDLNIETNDKDVDNTINDFFDENKGILEEHINGDEDEEKEGGNHELYINETADVPEDAEHNQLDETKENYIDDKHHENINETNEEENYIKYNQDEIDDNVINDSEEILEHEPLHENIDDSKESELENKQSEDNNEDNNEHSCENHEEEQQQQELNDNFINNNLDNAVDNQKASLDEQPEEIHYLQQKDQQENIDIIENELNKTTEIQQNQQFEETNDHQLNEELYNENLDHQFHEETEIQQIDEENNGVNDPQYDDIQENDNLEEQHFEEFQDNEQQLQEQEYEDNQDINNLDEQQYEEIEQDTNNYENIQDQNNDLDDQQQYEEIHGNFDDNEKEQHLEDNNNGDEINEQIPDSLENNENNEDVSNLIINENDNTYYDVNTNVDEILHINNDTNDTNNNLEDMTNTIENEDVDTHVNNDVIIEEQQSIDLNQDNIDLDPNLIINNQHDMELNDIVYEEKDHQQMEEDNINNLVMKEDQMLEENPNFEYDGMEEDHNIDVTMNVETEQGDEQMIMNDDLTYNHDNHEYFNESIINENM